MFKNLIVQNNTFQHNKSAKTAILYTSSILSFIAATALRILLPLHLIPLTAKITVTIAAFLFHPPENRLTELYTFFCRQSQTFRDALPPSAISAIAAYHQLPVPYPTLLMNYQTISNSDFLRAIYMCHIRVMQSTANIAPPFSVLCKTP